MGPLLTLHVGRPSIGDRDTLFRRLGEATDRLWLSNDGPLLVEMEAVFARFLGVKHCIAVANATLGLQLLAHALNLRGRVLIPAFTFIGTARAMEWQGLTPVFCDVLPDRHTLDPAAVRAALTPDTAAILGVHLWGRPCEIDALQTIADEAGIPLIFDAAHAVGSTWQGRRVGGFGRAEVFSLHATKAINALEGGLVTTDDDALAARLRLARNYGIADEDVFAGTGINAKMNEYSAAMALTNLENFDTLCAHNRAVQRAYVEGLAGAPGLDLVTAGEPEHNAHYAVLQVGRNCPLTRDALRKLLLAENVYSRRYFWPGCHRCPPYATQTHAPLPNTERLADQVLQLPTGMQISTTEARAIGECLAFALKHATTLTGQS